MAVGLADHAAGDAVSREHTPRPLTRHFHFDEISVKEEQQESGRADAGASLRAEGLPAEAEAEVEVAEGAVVQGEGEEVSAAEAAPTTEPAKPAQGEASSPEGRKNLKDVLASQRQKVEGSAETFESKPEVSTADASQLQGLSFDAPSVQEWLAQMETPEEDRTAELLAAGLCERGELPAHAPREADGGEVERLQGLTEAVRALQQQVAASRSAIEGRHEALAGREDELQEAERKLEKEREEQRRLEQARRDYPRPHWLVKAEGTVNVGVVGNSGVGKSLLINRLRGVPPGASGWAPVGVNETTLGVGMYAFPAERRARLWDFPGVGTPMFPLSTYIARMGLRYLDSVIIVTAGRFTQTEVALRAELEEHRVPYCMVRTKADIDVWNNREDNGQDEASTLREIALDLTQQCGGQRPYLVSLREPKAYDFPQLLHDAFPGLARAQWAATLGAGWDDPWVLPVALSATTSGIQGRWTDKNRAIYYISGLEVHVTQVTSGRAARIRLTETGDKVWWADRWYVDPDTVRRAGATGELRWINADRRARGRTVWRWMD